MHEKSLQRLPQIYGEALRAIIKHVKMEEELDSIFNNVVATMMHSFEFFPTDDWLDFSFTHEEGRFIIEAHCNVSGFWRTEGDGYFEPCDSFLVNGDGAVTELIIYDTNDDQPAPELLPKDITDRYAERLAEALTDNLIMRYG